MDHCLAADYPTAPTVNFDVVAQLRKWKTSGQAPDHIVVTESTKGQPDRRRLVCAYPKGGAL